MLDKENCLEYQKYITRNEKKNSRKKSTVRLNRLGLSGTFDLTKSLKTKESEKKRRKTSRSVLSLDTHVYQISSQWAP